MTRRNQATPGEDPTEKTRQLEEKITALENTTQQLQKKKGTMENQYEMLRQLINDTDTKLLVATARQEKDIQTLQTSVTSLQNIKNNGNIINTITKSAVDIIAPIFSGESKEEHPKQFLKDIHNYLEHKQITASREKMIVIENNLRGKASKWYTMIKDAALDEETFRELFLKHFFSENHQWEIFIKCTEAGKKPIKKDFQEHFHHWMAELKHLDSPKMNEEQAINLITKHFPIAIQAYIQTTKEKKFLPIWEKLGELENNKNHEEEPIKQNNQTQQFASRYNMQQQPRNFNYRQGQNNAIQQTRQPVGNNQTSYQPNTRQSAGEKTQQNQYVPKAVKQMVIYNDDDNETYEENDIETENSDESKNQKWGMMDLDQPLS
ncbi:AP2/ERF domain-containing protein PFD0985w-like [Aphis craccivora]|uniref:AP2/ERF domain-containing protein PFD0985w-like n=1 Tax=Aphis craccivora TaxID=307492 RepID=A0A6G0W5X6_APHCR|nr:AP2/ERF domain-containing protein PFD0985w-like [Aphis craccivora]